MKYNPDIHYRRSIRLQGYDYNQAGAYFITICTQNRECLLGDIQEGNYLLNEFSKIVIDVWQNIPIHFQNIEIDAYVVMPNHFHGIIVIEKNVEITTTKERSWNESKPMLARVVAYFKYTTTKSINTARQTAGVKVWQRNYYEHIIRSENSLNRLREYIANNPQQWETDQLHPRNPSKW